MARTTNIQADGAGCVGIMYAVSILLIILGSISMNNGCNGNVCKSYVTFTGTITNLYYTENSCTSKGAKGAGNKYSYTCYNSYAKARNNYTYCNYEIVKHTDLNIANKSLSNYYIGENVNWKKKGNECKNLNKLQEVYHTGKVMLIFGLFIFCSVTFLACCVCYDSKKTTSFTSVVSETTLNTNVNDDKYEKITPL